MTLNYEGEDSFKTVPGGLISIGILVIMFGYLILKFSSMINYDDWFVNTSQVKGTFNEIGKVRNLNETQF